MISNQEQIVGTKSTSTISVHFSINRDALFTVLKRHAGAVESTHSIKALSGAKINLHGNDLTLTVSNGDIEITSVVKADVKSNQSPMAFCIHFRKLYDICRLFSGGDTITFMIDDQWVSVSCGKAHFKLSQLDVDAFPLMPEVESKHAFPLTIEDLSTLVDKTAFCMGVQDVRFYLNGLLFEVRNQEVSAFSSDGHRLAVFELKNTSVDTQDFSMLIPRRAIGELSKIAKSHDSKGESCHLSVSDEYLKVSFGYCTVSIALLQAPPLNYRSLLPKEKSCELIVDRIELLASLSRCMILSHEKFSKVQMTAKKDAFHLMSKNLDHEKISDELSATYQGQDVNVSCNVYYVHEAISALDKPQSAIHFFGLNHALCIEDTNCDYHITYIIMPLSIDERCA